jgi:hypothetical protein
MDSCLRGAILNLTEIRSIWTLIEECSNIDTGAVLAYVEKLQSNEKLYTEE